MEIVNLGVKDGLPPVNWANVVEKLDAGSSPAPDAHNARTTWLSTVKRRQPACDSVGALWLDGASGSRLDRVPGRATTSPAPRALSRCRFVMQTSSPKAKQSGRPTPPHDAPRQGLDGPGVAGRTG